MSFLGKFSMGYKLQQEKKRKKIHSLTTNPLNVNNFRYRKGTLPNELASPLLELGYKLESLMYLIKVNPFSEVEEALNYLSKDPDTHKYNHYFYNPNNINTNNTKNGFNINVNNNNECLICKGTKEEHEMIWDEKIDEKQNEGNYIKPYKEKTFNKIKHVISIQNSDNFIKNNNNISIKNKSSQFVNNNNINNINSGDISSIPLNKNDNNNIMINNNENVINNNDNSINNLIKSQESIQNKNKNKIITNPPNLIDSITEIKKIPNQIEYKKIEIPQKTLELFNQPDICHICYSNKINPYNIAQISCGHYFCNSCIQTYLTSKIVNGEVLNIRCLLGGCPKIYSEEEIKVNVDEKTFKKYKKFLNIQIKLNNPDKNYVYCPFPDCEELVDADESDDDFLECNKGHIFCSKCHQLGRHKKGKCKNDELVLLHQIQNDNKNGINYKQCPKCHVIIEKNMGCNQMHCINCGYNFCWLCLKKYSSNHYSMYNVSGCPGMRYETDSGYKWRKNPCLKFLWYLFSCFLAFLAAIVIVIFYLIFGCAYEFYKCYTTKKSSDDDDDNDFVDIDFYDDERDENIYDDNNYFQDENNINNDDRNNKINVNVVNNNNNNNEDADVNVNGNENDENNKNNEKKNNNIFIIIILIILGLICQPLYLLFYILYALMECYRRFNCWFYYVDY